MALSTANDLLDLVESFLRDYYRLRERFDPDLAERLQRSAGQLKGFFEKLKNAADDLDDKQLKDPKRCEDRLEEAEKDLDDVFQAPGSLKPEEDNDKVSLRGFFHDVATSYREAQEALDIESLDYARNVPQGIPPAHFAIPNVRAEMEVGFERRRDREINLVFFGTRHGREEYGHSKISFEVVSAPPPPDHRLIGVPPYFVVGHESEQLLDGFRNVLATSDLVPEDFSVDSASTLLVRYRRKAFREERSYLVAAIDTAGGNRNRRRVAAAYIVRNAQGDYTLEDEIFTASNLPANVRNKLVYAPPKSELENESPTGLKKLERNLGDIVMSFLLTLSDWISEGGAQFPAFLEPLEERRAVLRAVYELPQVQAISELGSPGDYDSVFRHRVPDGWAPRRIVVLRGDRREPADWPALVIMGVIPQGDSYKVDSTFLTPVKNILSFDASDNDRPTRVIGATDALLEIRSMAASWLEFIRSGSSGRRPPGTA